MPDKASQPASPRTVIVNACTVSMSRGALFIDVAGPEARLPALIDLYDCLIDCLPVCLPA